MSVTRALLALGALAVLACHRRESAAPQAPSAALRAAPVTVAPSDLPPLDLPLAWTRLPLLPPGVQPPRWDKAVATWRTATTAYAQGEPEAASERFLEVAELLRTSAAGAEGRVSATGRCLAYENAGRALDAARKPERTRAVLTAASVADPACKHTLGVRLARLDRAETSSSAIRRAGP